VTSLCWWLYCVAERRLEHLTNRLELADHVCVAIWGTLATSLVYVTVWAWICALLSALPTQNPLFAFLSGGLVTIIAATSVVLGQRGFGPFMLLRGSNPQRVKTVVFFTTIMTAMMWVGALDYSLSWFLIPSWISSWCVALAICIIRWVLLWNTCGTRLNIERSSSSFMLAARSYPSTPDLALSVGLVVAREEPQGGRASPVPSLSELKTASLGLSALVVAWGGSVALQAASTATWKAWPFPYASTDAVAPATAYAIAMTSGCVYLMATARIVAEAEGSTMARADALAAETAALGVASGWSWYHALECIVPALCAELPFTRAIGTVTVTAFGVMVMLALKPPAGTAYADSSTHSGKEFSSQDASPKGPSPLSAVTMKPHVFEPQALDEHTTPYRAYVDLSGASVPTVPRATESPTRANADKRAETYRAFADLRRNHSADWLPPSTVDAASAFPTSPS